jgi:uncharacterized sulfatase
MRYPLTLLFLIACAGGALAAPPNVVLIIADDQAWTDYGFMGHPHIRTPYLDRLASQSLALRRGYVPSSLCSPSLATILTGLYPHQHGVTSNDPPLPAGKAGRAAQQDASFLEGRRRLIANFERVPTLPRLLAGRGYVSFQAGKWWGGDFRNGGFTHGMSHGDPSRGGRHGDEGLAIGRQTMRPVLDFIDQAARDEKPFLVWYAPMMPHSPHTPPERLLAHYRDKTASREVARYWAMCEWFDESCGQLLDHLDRKHLAENTLVVFLADNGWIQDPEADRYAPRSKQSPYDGGLRTPILLRWPGRIEPRRSEALASSIDLAPTILAAASSGRTSEMQGVNLLDPESVDRRDRLYGEIFTHNAVDLVRPASSLRFRWIVQGGWKLIVPDARNEPVAPVELFDVAHDPAESNDLAGRHSERVRAMRRALDAWWSAVAPDAG